MERTLEHALVERSWDAVVFDSICAGWALRHVRRHRARSARPREARLLNVPTGAPLLTMQRISYDDAGQPVEYGTHVYPAERYSFEMSVVADSRT